jgi:hypothetical protein
MSITHIWEETCSLCLSETSVLHLTQCPPIASLKPCGCILPYDWIIVLNASSSFPSEFLKITELPSSFGTFCYRQAWHWQKLPPFSPVLVTLSDFNDFSLMVFSFFNMEKCVYEYRSHTIQQAFHRRCTSVLCTHSIPRT